MFHKFNFVSHLHNDLHFFIPGCHECHMFSSVKSKKDFFRLSPCIHLHEFSHICCIKTNIFLNDLFVIIMYFIWKSKTDFFSQLVQLREFWFQCTQHILPNFMSTSACSALPCSPRYPPRIVYFSHSLHLSEKEPKLSTQLRFRLTTCFK